MRQHYEEVRARTKWLASGLSAEDQTAQSMPNASPVKWHLAHTSWFFETFVWVGALGRERLSPPAWGVLYNSYYEQIGEQFSRPMRGMLTRPSVQEINAYRDRVDAAMGGLLGDDPTAEIVALITLGLHHEQQHQELLCTDLLHLLSLNPLDPSAGIELRGMAKTAGQQPAEPTRWLRHPGGIVETGTSEAEFFFDNEGPRHGALLQAHTVCERLVTNAEYLEFMADGGYERFGLWTSLGWHTTQEQGWTAPLHWRKSVAGWSQFTLAGLIALDPEAAVRHISWFEADAYARWAGARLPTEFEWEAAAAEPLNSRAESDFYGHVWQWTASQYVGYPGYAPPAGAVGEYNGKFMCNQFVLRGSSAATSAGHARKTYRNFFPPECRWQFSGLRLAK